MAFRSSFSLSWLFLASASSSSVASRRSPATSLILLVRRVATRSPPTWYTSRDAIHGGEVLRGGRRGRRAPRADRPRRPPRRRHPRGRLPVGLFPLAFQRRPRGRP